MYKGELKIKVYIMQVKSHLFKENYYIVILGWMIYIISEIIRLHRTFMSYS